MPWQYTITGERKVALTQKKTKRKLNYRNQKKIHNHVYEDGWNEKDTSLMKLLNKHSNIGLHMKWIFCVFAEHELIQRASGAPL